MINRICLILLLGLVHVSMNTLRADEKESDSITIKVARSSLDREQIIIIAQRRESLKSWEVWLPPIDEEMYEPDDLSYALSFNKRLPANPLLPDVRSSSQKPRPTWIGTLESTALDLAKTAGKEDWGGFLARCTPGKDKEAKVLYDAMRIGCWYWKMVPKAVARNRKDEKLMVVELEAHASFTKPAIDSYARTMAYLKERGKNREYWIRDLDHGYRRLLFFRWNEEKKSWLVDPIYADKSLDDMFRKELFYSPMREKMWGFYKGMDDWSKPFEYKPLYVQNAHFSLKEGKLLETEVRIVHKPDAEPTHPLSRRERFMRSWKPYEFETFVYGMDWQKKYSRKQMEGFLAQVNRMNKVDVALFDVLCGKPRLNTLMGKYGLKLFKKPVCFIADPKYLDGMSDKKELLLGHVMTDFARKHYSATSLQQWKNRQLKYKEKAKRKFEKLGFTMMQLHGYQKIRFADCDTLFLFGLMTNPTLMETSPQFRFILKYSVSDDGALTTQESVLETQMASWLYRASLRYSSLLDAYFEEIGEHPFYRDGKVTGKQYHDRLKKLKIYDIFRIRKPEECTVYKKGLDHTKLPAWTLEEIEKAK